ncbi:TetR/AcrR family transcriptional regulator [Rhizobium hainanense]|uniref:Transcriptional regulator, TetR family n=1 Tax=Rhizobium hainanense TaxID=52131 RepID=A0A1C3W8G1_9HYPH|nr:TetR/AcrR family transcriptional regulator [Rhizobium hainanense]SCB36263.1 transcriptional regulator, TetR family [Rhizobium hainanense]
MAERKQEVRGGQMKSRGTSAKGAKRKEAIMAAAIRRFAEDGYQSASIASIADDAGLSQPGLLHYFPTKVDLLLAVLEQRDLESASVVHGTAEWRGLLGAMGEAVRRNAQVPAVIKAFAVLNAESLTAEHPAQSWFLKRSRSLQLNIAASFERAAARKEIRGDVDCRAIAAELIAMMDGLQMLWLRDPDAVDMVRVFDGYIDRLIESIASDRK